MDKINEDVKYCLAIGNNPKIGAVGFGQILRLNLSFKEIFHAKGPALKALNLSDKIKNEISYCQKNIDPEDVINELKKHHVSVLTIASPKYPKLLKEIYDPPVILYYKGDFCPTDLSIGIVGCRKPTDYGKHITFDLASTLASSGFSIISGLALGIDTVAHQATLFAKGKTLAVLGCGLDRIYPITNEGLAKEILANGGTILSEYPIGTPPMKQNFPARNRIISGLSQGLVVTEASNRSGSLITARAALEQNREVFAVPGSVYNVNSYGPNTLIKMGAHLISGADDILDEFGLKAPEEIARARTIFPGSPTEELVFKVLKDSPKHIDLITKESSLKQNEISSVLTMMEITGKVKHLGGMVYRLNN